MATEAAQAEVAIETVLAAETEIVQTARDQLVQARAEIEVLVQAAAVTVAIMLAAAREVVQAAIEIAAETEIKNTYPKPEILFRVTHKKSTFKALKKRYNLLKKEKI